MRRKLGTGGQGSVYEAYSTIASRRCAIKLFLHPLSWSQLDEDGSMGSGEEGDFDVKNDDDDADPAPPRKSSRGLRRRASRGPTFVHSTLGQTAEFRQRLLHKSGAEREVQVLAALDPMGRNPSDFVDLDDRRSRSSFHFDSASDSGTHSASESDSVTRGGGGNEGEREEVKGGERETAGETAVRGGGGVLRGSAGKRQTGSFLRRGRAKSSKIRTLTQRAHRRHAPSAATSHHMVRLYRVAPLVAFWDGLYTRHATLLEMELAENGSLDQFVRREEKGEYESKHSTKSKERKDDRDMSSGACVQQYSRAQ